MKVSKFKIKEERRIENIQFTQSFLTNLTNFSLYLKKKITPDGNKNPIATIFLNKINNQLKKRWNSINSDNSVYSKGSFLPLGITNQSFRSTLVVGIIVSEVQCFETNKRVPYKVVFECIEFSK